MVEPLRESDDSCLRSDRCLNSAQAAGRGANPSKELVDPTTPAESVVRGHLNSFALVAYLPDPLQQFLNSLRMSLEPAAESPRAHVTALSPRPLAPGTSTQDAQLQLSRTLPRLSSFEIAIGPIAVFPDSRVIYLELESGWEELQLLHAELNQGVLHAPERFQFHPHITLAQNIAERHVEGLAQVAADVWNQYDGTRAFLAENFTLVQNTASRGWRDVMEFSLAPVAIL